MNKKSELYHQCQNLISEMEEYLQQYHKYLTDGTVLAVKDILLQTKCAMKGENVLPFKRNRGFYVPREEEALAFAYNHYTMCPTYLPDGQVYSEYGLKACTEWMKTQNFALYTKKELAERQQDLLQLKAELDEFHGSEPLQSTHLNSQIQQLVSENRLEYARNLVSCFNLLRNYRQSLIKEALSHTEGGTLCFSQAEIHTLKRQILEDTPIKRVYQEIKNIADTNSLEDINRLKMLIQEEPDYEKANRYFPLWATSDKVMNFTTPKNAAYASLSFLLSGKENFRHVWVTKVQVLGVNSSNWEVPDILEKNSSGWRTVSLQGNPKMGVEYDTPYTMGEAAALKIALNTEQDYGGWETAKPIKIEGNSTYTICFLAKIDGKIEKGLEVKLTYYDKNKQKIDSSSYHFKRQSGLMGSRYMISLQCDAFIYGVTGERKYAEKAKKEIFYFLQEFSQGIEHWLVKNERPFGSDAYGAVQAGRLLCCVAFAYDFIRSQYTSAEKQAFYQAIDYYLRYLIDLRDRTELPASKAQKNCSNWQMDMCAGTVMMMLAVESDFPQRETWLCNALHVLKSQLRCNINQDGSWPESIRYHFAVLVRMSDILRVILNKLGENWYESTKFLDLFRYACKVHTPFYPYFDSTVSTFAFGDSIMAKGGGYHVFRHNLDVVERYDKTLADRMYTVWKMAGKPQSVYHSENLIVARLFAAKSYHPQDEGNQVENSSQSFPQAGLHLIRDGKDSALCVMSSPHRIGHGHLDQGSFIWFVQGYPVVTDPGIAGYFDSSVQWYLSSRSHACLQLSCTPHENKKVEGFINLTVGDYSTSRGWQDTPKESELLKFDAKNRKISVKISYPHQIFHFRTFCWQDETTLRIEDRIEGDYSDYICISLPMAVKNFDFHQQTAQAIGLFGQKIQIQLFGAEVSFEVEKGQCAKGQVPGESLLYLRIKASNQEPVITQIHIV